MVILIGWLNYKNMIMLLNEPKEIIIGNNYSVLNIRA